MEKQRRFDEDRAAPMKTAAQKMLVAAPDAPV
jgi:hypothetical protein